MKTEDRFSATIAAAAVDMAKLVDGGHTEVVLSEVLRVALSHLFTVEDVAERYGVTVQTVYAWNHKGTGPRFIHAGRLPRYRLSDCLVWENGRYADGGGEAA